MVRQLLPISALLFGSALLLFAGGINGLILPVRGGAEGFSAASLGLLGAGWAIGYVLGCLATPRLVSKVGHVRSFGVMCAFASVSVLMSLVFMAPEAWIPLRAISGFCFAGAAMIVESWLSERADASSRGKVFGLYTMVNLLASTGGQMSLTLGDTTGFLFFVLSAVFYSLALVPTAISSTASPRPLRSVSLDLRGLWRNSPIAVVAVLFVGVSNSAFGTLAAVYADRMGLVLASVAMFASLPILAGAISQIPIGWLSDRMDRRKVLIGVCIIAVLTDLSFILLQPESRMMNLVLASVFGATIYAMYPILIAHANDHAPADSGLQVSGGLLMIYGIGGIIGPTLAGFGMGLIGPSGLFITSICAHVLIICFAILRIMKREAVPEEDKSTFVVVPPARTSTPEITALVYEDEPQDDPTGETAGPDDPAEETKPKIEDS